MLYFEAFNKIILNGGKDEKQAILGDTWLLDISSLSWSQLSPECPPIYKDAMSKCHHSGVINNQSNTSMVIFGGYNSSNFLPNQLFVLEFDQNNRVIRKRQQETQSTSQRSH